MVDHTSLFDLQLRLGIQVWQFLLQQGMSDLDPGRVGNLAHPADPVAATSGFSATLDIARALSAVLWPLVVLAIVLIYRRSIPTLVSNLSNRVTKLGFAGVSLELAKATPFVPEWSVTAGALDLRQKAAAVFVNDSTAMTFRAQLRDGGTADYAEVNLGSGKEWLSSRLFIMAIVFARVKGIRSLVFVETSGQERRRYVGWAAPDKVRWSLAKRYSWLEEAYAQAYSTILNRKQAFVMDHNGRLGNQNSPIDPQPSLELMREFLQIIQIPPPALVPADDPNWVLIDATLNTSEHTSWETGESIESMLGNDLHKERFRAKEASSLQSQQLLADSSDFIAVVDDNQRFDYLVDRSILLKQIATTLFQK
jgi:hypothetical protein